MNYVTPRSSPRLYLNMTLDNIVSSEKNSVSSEVYWTYIIYSLFYNSRTEENSNYRKEEFKMLRLLPFSLLGNTWNL